MARPFSPSEAKEALRKAQTLLDGIKVISEAAAYGPADFEHELSLAQQELLDKKLKQISVDDLVRLPVEARNNIKKLGFCNVFDLYRNQESIPDDRHANKVLSQISACVEAIRALYRPDPKGEHMLQGISLAVRYNKAEQLAELFKPVLDDARDIASVRDLVGAHAGRLRWLISNAEEKQQTVEAFDRLQGYVSDSYIKFVKSGIKSAQSIITWKLDDPIDPKAQEKAMATIAATIGQDLFAPGSVPSRDVIEADLKLAEEKMRLEALDRMMSAIEGSEKSICDQVNGIQTSIALHHIAEQPIEELRDMVPGVRVKTLKDAGYNTLGDVIYDRRHFGSRTEDLSPDTQWRQTSRLSNIRGISYDAAERITIAIKRQVNLLVKETKIRLTSDDKNPEHTKLLQYIYRNFELEAQFAAADKTADSLIKEYSTIKNRLKPTRYEYTWLFCEDRDKVYAAYGQLKALLSRQELNALNNWHKDDVKELSAQEAWGLFDKDPIRVYGLLEKLFPEAFSSGSSGYGLPEGLAKKIETTPFDTKGLKCELRTYQTWGVRYILHQGNALLGDEMGLGKTIQAIAAMTALRNEGARKFLVICPASLIENWVREIQKHSDLTCTKMHGPNKDLEAKRWLSGLNVGVTNFENARSIQLDTSKKLDLIVVDEAHYIKNPEAKRTISTLKLCNRSKRILFMSGTPLENNVDEMINLIFHLNRDTARTAWQYANRYRSSEFRDAIAPVYYRRRREDVLSELPDLIENSDWCQMGTQELKTYYQTLKTRKHMIIRRLSWNVPDPCCSSKLNRLREIVAEAKDENRKVLVFSFFLETIETVKSAFGDACYGPISGRIPLKRRQEIIDSFDDAPAGSVLAAQIQSGGTGLNIQSASVVVLCEPQYKPSIENQAIARAYRMGQSRNVLVHRLLCEDTIDERIMQILARKQDDFDAFADKSAAAEADVQNEIEIKQEQLNAMFDEEIKRLESLMPSLVKEDDMEG